MTGKITVRGLRPDDMDRYVELCASRPDLDRRAAELRAELVEWMAFHNPHPDGDPTYLVLEQGDRLVGHMGRMPTRFCVDGDVVQAAFWHDLYIREELARAGRGFFLSMRLYAEAEKTGQNFVAMTWTNDINMRLQKARKYHEMWADRRVKLLRADAHIDRQLGKLENQLGARLPVPGLPPVLAQVGKQLARTALSVTDQVLARLLAASSEAVELVEIGRFDARFDELAERIGRRMGIAARKDSAYLNWKYTDRPQLDTHHYMALDRSGQIVGLVVVAVPPSEYHESYILELVADPEDSRTVAALVHRAVERCRAGGAYTVQSMATDPRIIAVLDRFLFLPRPPREPFFLTHTDRYARPARLTSIASWHVSFGDSEGNV